MDYPWLSFYVISADSIAYRCGPRKPAGSVSAWQYAHAFLMERERGQQAQWW
jgi:hypothetical protein